MFLQTLLKKNQRIRINTYLYLKKKYLIILTLFLLKLLKRNYYLIKSMNFIKFILFIINIVTKINKQYNLSLYTYFNTKKNLKLNNYTNSKIYNLISYIIKITLLKSNIFINVTNIKGIILTACSSGLINLNGSQKTKRLAYNRIIRFTKFKIRKLKNKIFAIHFIGIKSNRKKLLKSFKRFFNIKNVKYFNLIAHNGCRLKK